MSFIIVYVPCKDKDEAEKIGRHIVENKLAACTNAFPIESMYMWKGVLEKEPEYVMLLKTKKELWETLKKAITKIHSYEVPAIIKFEVEANTEYEEWINKETL